MHALFAPRPDWPAQGALLLYAPGLGAEAIEAAAAALGFSGGEPAKARIALPHGDGVEARELEALALPLEAALPALLGLPATQGAQGRRLSDALRAWSLAARIALAAVAAERSVPALRPAAGGDVVHGVWQVEQGEGPGRQALARLAAAMPRAAHALVGDDGRMWEALDLLEAFEEAVADHAVRAGGEPPAPGRPRERLLPWTARWAAALSDPADPVVPLRDDAADLVAGMRSWGRPEELAGVLHVRLEAPAEIDGEWRLALGLLGSDGRLRPAAEVWEPGADETLPAAQLHEAFLRGIALAARLSPPFELALRNAAPAEVAMDLGQAWGFISEAAPALRDAGVIVELPDGLAEEAIRLRFVIGRDLSADADRDGDADLESIDFTLQDEVIAAWEVDLGGTVLDDAELERLLASEVPLVRWRDQWVRVDPERLRGLRKLGAPVRLGLGEALAMALAGSRVAELTGDDERTGLLEDAEVVARGRVAALVERIRAAAEPRVPEAEPEGFVGELRPYQRRGLAWLHGMGELGLGGILADDMGLGKTVQLIAYLLALVADDPDRPRRHLIVCPTSVLGNWQRELARFAPGLAVTRFHGLDRPDDLAATQGVVLTSYGMLRREGALLASADWDVVAIDEAQHVKNPATSGAKAARALRARQKVAMTGTPLENRLGDLWALMDMVNAGLLGTRGTFDQRFANPIERGRDASAARRLRRLVAPFVLRREKRDPAVIADLPEKIEREVPCGLTEEQVELYEQAVNDAFSSGLGEGIARRGRVLALLTALKQICNHPAHFRKQEDEPLPGRSGKLATARELVREAVDAGEQVLVFTQFTTMGRLLVRQFGDDLGTWVPFLHGGVRAEERDRIVAAFQGEGEVEPPPVLIVSLRAGGTGLNLTAATHVLHYDRWWNPAVEDQATDRAHRIGQRHAVEVHKLVTAGTVEERIAAMLERKRALADAVVGAGEAWVTELGDQELRELVALSRQQGFAAAADDDDEAWAEAGA